RTCVFCAGAPGRENRWAARVSIAGPFCARCQRRLRRSHLAPDYGLDRVDLSQMWSKGLASDLALRRVPRRVQAERGADARCLRNAATSNIALRSARSA